jgi:hypothetical protein
MLVFGMERIRLDSFLQAFTILPVDPVIAVTGGLFRRDYGKNLRHWIG